VIKLRHKEKPMQTELKETESRGDLYYVNRVNALIPDAVLYANKKMRKHKGLRYVVRKSDHDECEEYNHDLWTHHFCEKMKELTSGFRN
jgi:hypothetical protein